MPSKVRHIRSPKTILPKELHAVLKLQEARDTYEKARANYVQMIRERLEDGASIKDGRYKWDPVTGHVTDVRAKRARRASLPAA